jgi:hypothetical protein
MLPRRGKLEIRRLPGLLLGRRRPMMTSRSSKIRGRHLALVLNTLIAFLSYQGIAASQDSQAISVLGEVTKPGVYPVLSTRKLVDMISEAGGTTPKAGRDILITHRNQRITCRRLRCLVSQLIKRKQMWTCSLATRLWSLRHRWSTL